jgi:hypothetical protein
MSYTHVAGELRSRFGLSAVPSTILAFVKVRSRRRTGFVLPAPEPPRRAPSATAQQTPSPVRPAAQAPAAANWYFERIQSKRSRACAKANLAIKPALDPKVNVGAEIHGETNVTVGSCCSCRFFFDLKSTNRLGNSTPCASRVSLVCSDRTVRCTDLHSTRRAQSARRV